MERGQPQLVLVREELEKGSMQRRKDGAGMQRKLRRFTTS